MLHVTACLKALQKGENGSPTMNILGNSSLRRQSDVTIAQKKVFKPTASGKRIGTEASLATTHGGGSAN